MSDSFSERPLIDLANLVMGQSPDSQYVYDDLEHGAPFLQGNAEFGDAHPHPVYSCSQPARVCKKDDVLISVRAPVGEINVADSEYCIGRGLAAIRFRDVPATLGAKLVSKFSPALKRVAQGTTFEAIGKNELASLRVLVPPSSEWEKIAQILDTLDTQIRLTEALIAKLERIKQGLLTDLLTRGIDQNGQLRPTPDQAPHFYKDSPLGRIPREWGVRQIGDIVDSLVDGPFGSNLKTEHYVSEPGVRVVRLQNLLVGKYNDTDRAFITAKHASELVRNTVTSGDVLVAALGDETNPLGRACLYPSDLPPAINKADCFRLRSSASIAVNEFVMHFLNSSRARDQVKRYQQGVTLQRINLRNLRSISATIPPVEEQQSICSTILAISVRLESSGEEIEKLRKQKSGLMDDLLTGRVRVTPLLESPSSSESRI